MRLSPPTILIFLISLVLAVAGILPYFGINMPALPFGYIWLLFTGYVLLALGCLFKGL